MDDTHDPKLTHIDAGGRPLMVDVSAKGVSARRAVAAGFVRMNRQALELVRSGCGKKGDAAQIAELAGIMGAKRTADLIPLCHPLPIAGAVVETTVDEKEGGVRVTAEIKTTARTGVEMEALTAVSVACLTLYDMLKSVDRSISIEAIGLSEKSGGASGDFVRNRSK